MADLNPCDSSQTTTTQANSFLVRMLFKLFSPTTYVPNAWLQFLYTSAGKLGLFSVLSVTILWASAFLYITFYYQYIPIMSHRHAINLHFDARCNQETCSQPSANLSLLHRKSGRVFAKGQAYRIAVQLHLPESEVNWQQGTFMIKLKLVSASGTQVTESSRAGMLKYKSPIVRAINDFVCWPLFMIGLQDSSQILRVTIFDEYYDNTNLAGEATSATISIEARNIQIYSAELQIDAILSGIRYYMVYWPLISSIFGISLISSFLAVLALSTFQNVLFMQQNQSESSQDEQDNLIEKEFETKKVDPLPETSEAEHHTKQD